MSSRSARAILVMEPAVDTGKFMDTLPRSGGRVGIAVANGAEPDLASILANVAEKTHFSERQAAIRESLDKLVMTPAARARLGTQLEGLVSSWRHTDRLDELANYLSIVVTLDNVSSTRCLSWALRRSLPRYIEVTVAHDLPQLDLILETTLSFSNNTVLDLDFVPLREIFRSAVPNNFSLLARIGGRLLDGNRDGTQSLDPREMVQMLFARNRIAALSSDILQDGAKQLIVTKPVERWKEILSSLYFGESESQTDFGSASREFLRACFNDEDPPLLLVLFSGQDETWLIRTIDLDVRGQSLPALYEQIRSCGTLAPDLREHPSELLNGEFFDRVANARRHSREWLLRQVDNVRPLFPKGRPR